MSIKEENSHTFTKYELYETNWGMKFLIKKWKKSMGSEGVQLKKITKVQSDLTNN
jgi:hypothetical protein